MLTRTQDIRKRAHHNHRLGHLQSAETLYHQVLDNTPGDSHALHALGIIAYQRGQYARSLDYVTGAIKVSPEIAQFHNTQGVVLEMLDQLDNAKAAYTRAMSLKAHYAEAQTNLAILQQRQGHWHQAIEQCQEVLKAHPQHARAYQVQAFCCQQLGHRDKAIKTYERAVQLDPSLAEAHNQMGVLLAEQAQYDRATAALQQALTLRPDYAEAHNNLGICLHAQGHAHQAITHYQEAIRLDPKFSEAFYNLANVQAEHSALHAALGNCAQAIRLNPLYACAYNQLGLILHRLGQNHQAIEAYQSALALDPRLAECHNNLGIVYREQGDFIKAQQCYEQALGLGPRSPETLYNLANTCKELGQCQTAIQLYTQAIDLRPDYADAHWNLSIAYLLQGDLARGWNEYRWRTRVQLPTPLCPHDYDRPRWTGAPFRHQRLLVYSEQGLGDTIQFARYLPRVKALGGQVLLETWAPLRRLVQALGCVDRVVETSAEKIPNKAFDLCVSIMDLPCIFQTTLDTIPTRVPYLKTDQPDRKITRLQFSRNNLNVGIVWAGAPTHGNDRQRSCSLHHFKSIANLPGVRLFSLQKGPARAQLNRHPDLSLQDLVMSCQDLMDTARVIACLDLVISVDTAVAHLAGALGRPTWTLLPFAPDWRWLLVRQDTPWYPSMRLFRQTEPGNWQGVFQRVEQALNSLRQASSPDQCAHAGKSELGEVS